MVLIAAAVHLIRSGCSLWLAILHLLRLIVLTVTLVLLLTIVLSRWIVLRLIRLGSVWHSLWNLLVINRLHLGLRHLLH